MKVSREQNRRNFLALYAAVFPTFELNFFHSLYVGHYKMRILYLGKNGIVFFEKKVLK